VRSAPVVRTAAAEHVEAYRVNIEWALGQPGKYGKPISAQHAAASSTRETSGPRGVAAGTLTPCLDAEGAWVASPTSRHAQASAAGAAVADHSHQGLMEAVECRIEFLYHRAANAVVTRVAACATLAAWTSKR